MFRFVLLPGFFVALLTSVDAQQLPVSPAPRATLPARTFVVTDPGDMSDALPADTLCYPCTLRAAMENAERTPAPDLIVFSPLVPVVTILSALPEMKTPLLLDGWLDSTHNVALDGAQASNSAGLRLSGGGSAARNLEIRGFSFGGVVLAGGDSSAVQGCFIHDNGASGVTVSSKYHLVGASALGYPNTIAANSGHGIALLPGADYTAIVANRIGTANGSTAAPNGGCGVSIASSGNLVYANLLSGNTRHGVATEYVQPAPEKNTISSNFIGTSASALAALPNGEDGVHLSEGRADTIAYNVISGNIGTGIAFGAETGLSAAGLWIAGNYIGTDLHGGAALPNSSGIIGRGSGILIGGNLISGNKGAGIGVTGTAWTVRANSIGCDSAGSAAIPNGSGITVSSSPTVPTDSVLIGGSTLADGNLISGNNGSGVLIAGPATSRVTVSQNIIGLASGGAAGLPNIGSGVWITDGAHHTFVQNNLLSSNTKSGVTIDIGPTGAPHDNTVRGNRIGTDRTGTAERENNAGGISINKSPSNLIGGTGIGDGNLIYGGIAISGKESVFNVIQGNLIGTDSSGKNPLNTGRRGVSLTSTKNTVIGGSTPAEGNVIYGPDECVMLLGADSNRIAGNRIGLESKSSNTSYGVRLESSNANIIGGTGSEGNVIVRCGQSYILFNNSHYNAIRANRIGVADTGGHYYSTVAVVLRSSSNNVIGGLLSGQGNIIAFSSHEGLVLEESDSNLVAMNGIGTDATGTAQFGNTTQGILIQNATGNVIGGEGIGNIIAFNWAGSGVAITGNGTNLVSANAIYDNQFGISLAGTGGSGSRNDTLDTDTGPNGLQNYPTISDAYAGNQTRVSGVLNSAANGAYMMQFFASPRCDTTGYGQGKRYLGSSACATDANGIASFAVTLGSSSADGEAITATAIDALGNTSQFSRCVTALPPPRSNDLSLLVTALRDTVSIGDTLVYMLNAVNHGPNEATGVLLRDTIPALLSYISSTASHGSATYAAGILECRIPSLQKSEVASITVRARALAAGTVRLRAAVFAIENDSVPANNTGARTVVIREVTGIANSPAVGAFLLAQNYPNPFTQHTTISFELPHATHATVKVYNIYGALVATPADGYFTAGRHDQQWNAGALPRGVYTCVLSGSRAMRAMRMVAE